VNSPFPRSGGPNLWGNNTGGYYQCLMYVRHTPFTTLHKMICSLGPGAVELPRILLPRTRVNKGMEKGRGC
jgi:hypothetical protein